MTRASRRRPDVLKRMREVLRITRAIAKQNKARRSRSRERLSLCQRGSPAEMDITMNTTIPAPLLEAFSAGQITRRDIEEKTGRQVRFGVLLDQLHAHGLPLPRFPANPEKAKIVADLFAGASHVG